jgi:hypothetical protein
VVGGHGCTFRRAKQALLSATHLAHPTVGAELLVDVDALPTHVSACLQQLLPGKKDWYPLVFFPKKLAVQQKYSAFDRELFTCYSGIRHFRYMLDDRRFAIFTDHKPQVRMSNPWIARQSRQLSYVAAYMSDICHIAEAAKVVADTLSRLPRHAVARRPPSAVTYVKVQATKSSSLKVRNVQEERASLLGDVAHGITRALVPLEDRPAIFHAIHSMAHCGIHATKCTVTACFMWKGVGKDVVAMCQDYQQCQRGKVHKQPAALSCWHKSFPTFTWTW